MASYDVTNDIVGGGYGGFGGFGGGCGLLVVLLILFAVFSGGGLFGRHDGHHDDGWHRDFFAGKFPCCDGTSNCQIDKDVLTSRDAGIIEQNRIYEKGLERKLIERDMIIQEQKNQLFVGGMFAELMENLNCKFGHIEKELCKKPDVVPHYAKTVDGCVQPQMNCFDRFREGRFEREGRRDRDDCCFC